MRAGRGLRPLLVLATVAYVVSVLPGVRGEPGYSRLWEVGVYNLILWCVLGLCVARAVRQPADRVAWVLIATGMASYALGTLVFSLWLQPMALIPYPSVSDLLWLTFYPLALAGLGLAARRRIIGRSASLWLDGLTAGLGLAAIGAVVVFDHLTVGAVGSFTAIVVNFAYPVADLALAASTVGAMAVLGAWHNRTWQLLAAGFVTFAVADSWYVAQVAADAYRPGSAVDAMWATALCLLGLAASGRGSPAAAVAETRSFLIPTVFAVVAVALLGTGAVVPIPAVSTVLAVAALAAACLRSAVAVREVVALADSRQQARTDPLTGLPNRRVVGELLDGVNGAGGAGSLLLIDLDRFKEVNDALGHRTGDGLLRAVAERLSAHLLAAAGGGGGATLARLGGDEFAVLLPGVAAADAAVLARELRARLQQPFTVAAMTLHVDASIGVTTFGGATDADRDLARADLAMYRAKAARTGVELYDDDRDGDAWDRLALVEDLRCALVAGDLHVELQPIVALPTRAPAAFEALVRWTHPVRGRLAPDDFLPLVERAGLMGILTRHVLDRALDEAVALRRAGCPVPVAVNLSASDLLDCGLVDVVADGLDRRALPGEALHLEITESLLMEDRDVSGTVLRRLRGLGVQIAVDDFGTGYSSLAYLRDLPVDVLKIDRSFVDQLHGEARTPTIVASIIGLAHDLGLHVVAEGVETADQLDWLLRHGCDRVQGYHLGRPMTPDALHVWLAGRERPAAPEEVLAVRRTRATVVPEPRAGRDAWSLRPVCHDDTVVPGARSAFDTPVATPPGGRAVI